MRKRLPPEMSRLVSAVALCALALPLQAELLGPDEQAVTLTLNGDNQRFHEGFPAGVPRSYDWYARPQLKQGNDPKHFKAMTGWGHAFWESAPAGSDASLQLRKLRVYLCKGDPHRWWLVQSGDIHGRQFAADFKHNYSLPAPSFTQANGVASVAFDYGTAFHFWPAMGRTTLPEEPLCGFVVLVEARLMRSPPGTSPSSGKLLLGLGADYWLDSRAPWGTGQANKGIALGRLRFISDDWAWYGLSTASNDDVARLLADGFTTPPRMPAPFNAPDRNSSK